MMPDVQSYFEACFWYCAQKILYIKYIKGEVHRQLWIDAKNSYNFYRKQAYAESLMPNQDELSGIEKTWNRLIPELNSDRTFMSTISDPERIYNQNRYDYVRF